MIEANFRVCDGDLDEYNNFTDRDDAEEYAARMASERERYFAVMLHVPGPAGEAIPEMRALVIFDDEGRRVWETDVYDAELVATEA